MGNPLPGVEIGLEAAPRSGERVFKLWLRSPFGFDRYFRAGNGEARAESLAETGGWFYTGDLVERNPAGLKYVGREQTDFVKDGFGVKVPLALLHERYRDLDVGVRHVEVFPLAEEPGLAALVFMDGRPGDGADESPTIHTTPWLKNRRICQRIRGKIEARHEKLLAVLDDFELRHLTIARFACVAEPPPLTVKGSVVRQQIESKYPEALKVLTGRLVRADGVVRIKRERLLQSAYTRLTSPRRGELLHLARLDKNYVRAEGDYLDYEQWGELKRVLDLVGGFGINLFGHRHPRSSLPPRNSPRDISLGLPTRARSGAMKANSRRVWRSPSGTSPGRRTSCGSDPRAQKPWKWRSHTPFLSDRSAGADGSARSSAVSATVLRNN